MTPASLRPARRTEPSHGVRSAPPKRSAHSLELGQARREQRPVAPTDWCETQRMAGPVTASGQRPSTLPPLRWIAEEDLLYDPDTNTLHRPDCPCARATTRPTRIPARSALELIWAPTICACQPDVTLGLRSSA
jgi:hypothetical protein